MRIIILIGSILLCGIVTAQNRISPNLKKALIPYRVGNKWGYSDKKGNLVIAPKFDGAGVFLENLTWVRKRKKYGFINKAGELVIDYRFTEARPFQRAQAQVVERGRKFWINEKGKEKEMSISSRDNYMSLGTKDIQVYVTNKKRGVVKTQLTSGDANDCVRPDSLPPIWDKIISNHAGFAAAKTEGRWAVISINGLVQNDQWYDSLEVQIGASLRYRDQFIYWNNGKCGLLSRNGSVLTEAKYVMIEPLKHRLFKVWLDEKFWGYLGLNGTEYFQRK